MFFSFSWRFCKALFSDIVPVQLLGLHALHQRGILHRDVKTGNLLLDPGGNLMIIDFGVAVVFDEPTDRERWPHWFSLKAAGGDDFPPLWPAGNPHTTKGTAGTRGYMAPEVDNNQSLYSYGVDLFSFGAVLYDWWTAGRVGFRSL